MQKIDIRNGGVLWLTGLPCSGKTTLAKILEKKLQKKGHYTDLIDGGEIRKTWPKKLGFSKKDRMQNIKRVALLAGHSAKKAIVIVALISPYKKAREQAREITERNGHKFVEIYLNCPLEECERRDTKGFYKKARAGKIKNFTGIDDPYEEPENPDITIYTKILNVKSSAEKILERLTF